MARTPIYSLLRESLRRKNLSRRQFLGTAAFAAISAGLIGSVPAGARALLGGSGRRRVVVVGAGLAGLNASRILRAAGWEAPVYEASARTGGRVRSAVGHFAPGMVTELGGEFIDSSHEDLLALCRQYGLDFWDRAAGGEDAFEDELFFDGRRIGRTDIGAALAPFEDKIVAAIERMGAAAAAGDWDTLRTQDQVPLSRLFDELGITGWFRDFVDMAYLAEFGLPIEEQSSLNFLFLFDPEVAREEGEAYGPSDERFKIRGGNEALARELTKRAGPVRTGHRLISLARGAGGYELVFAVSGSEKEREVRVQADFVVLALPFTALRKVALDLPLDEGLRDSIRTLGYGQNTKLVLGFRDRFWRESGGSGEVLTDTGFQACWDSSRFQAGTNGTLTLYSAADKARAVGANALANEVRDGLAQLAAVWPRAEAAFDGQRLRIDWSRVAGIEGSYACCKVGQWVPLQRLVSEAGNVFFAGEQYGHEFQGYMNGALLSGRLTAEKILARG